MVKELSGREARRGAAWDAGTGIMVGSALSNQWGAALAALALPALGPAEVVAIRQWVAAAVLLAIGRPRIRSFSGAQWRIVAALALVYATMNLTLYTAIERLGLGLAVTLEFLGPLAVALAGTRRRRDLACALAAALAVCVLARPQPSTDYLGIGLALVAATCWACYILLNRSAGAVLQGAQGSAAAAAVSALLYVPAGAVLLTQHSAGPAKLACAAAAGVLSSAVPFAADVWALRRVPAQSFGLFMSVNPVFAALIGLLVLGQPLSMVSWAAIAVVVVANVVSRSGAWEARPASGGRLHSSPSDGPVDAGCTRDGPATAAPADPALRR